MMFTVYTTLPFLSNTSVARPTICKYASYRAGKYVLARLLFVRKQRKDACANSSAQALLAAASSKHPLPLAALARTRTRTRTPVDDDPLVSLLELSPDLLAVLYQISCIPLEKP